MRRFLAYFLLGLGAVVASGPSWAIVVGMDQFTVTKNGVAIFTDGFTDGNPPPSAPNFGNGSAASYSVTGAYPPGSEAGGVLQLNSANGVVTTNAQGQNRQTQGAILLTSPDPQAYSALDSGSTLNVRGVFNLVTPVGPRLNAYAIQVGDFFGTVNQLAELQVVYNPVTGQAEVRYLFQNFASNSISVLGSVPFAPPAGTDQVRLDLSKPDAAGNGFTGSYAFLQAGAEIGGGTFQTQAFLFDGEATERARFVAFSAVPEPGTVALFGLGAFFLGLARRRRAN